MSTMAGSSSRSRSSPCWWSPARSARPASCSCRCSASSAWQTSEISGALAIRLLLFGLMGPFAAALINRFGVRTTAISSLALISSGLALSLAMTQVWQLILLWGVVVGFGTGLTALVLGATIATRWFSTRRGLVIGLLTASSATGQLVFMPLLATIAEDAGWRAALVLLCGLLALAPARSCS